MLSPEQLNSLLVRCTISPAAAASAADPSSSAVDSLGALVRWHAVFPFPAAPSSSFAGLDLPSLLRALALLLAPPPITPTIALDTATAGGPLPPSPCGVRSGRWAAHDGWLVTKRGRGAEDALRRVFRSLAAEEAPTSPPAAGAGAGDDEATAVVRVPRFVMYVPRGTNDGGRVGGVTAAALADDDNDDLGQQVVVVQDEDERTVDLLDVLSECPPDEDRKTANPLRENWVGVLAALPRHDRHLGQLGVPRARLAGLLGLLADADPDMHRLLGPSGPLNGLTATPFGEDITWDAFNSALLEYTVSCTSPLIGMTKDAETRCRNHSIVAYLRSSSILYKPNFSHLLYHPN